MLLPDYNSPLSVLKGIRTGNYKHNGSAINSGSSIDPKILKEIECKAEKSAIRLKSALERES